MTSNSVIWHCVCVSVFSFLPVLCLYIYAFLKYLVLNNIAMTILEYKPFCTSLTIFVAWFFRSGITAPKEVDILKSQCILPLQPPKRLLPFRLLLRSKLDSSHTLDNSVYSHPGGEHFPLCLLVLLAGLIIKLTEDTLTREKNKFNFVGTEVS